MPDAPAWCKIREHFGPGVLHPDGQIDRQALADIVFADKGKLALLNEITHPAIRPHRRPAGGAPRPGRGRGLDTPC